jgi:hypothetical protein
MKYKTIFLILLSILLHSCTENPVEPGINLFVIEAFLYEGDKVSSVHITETLSVSSGDTIVPGIDNAVVKLIKNGIVYSLIKTADSSGYYHYTGTDLDVNTGDNFKIEVTYNGVTASGETIIPVKPYGINISPTVLVVPEGLSMQDVFDGDIDADDYSITLSWNNPDSSFYYVVVQNLETDPENILDTSSSNGTNFGAFSRFQTPPTRDNELVLNPFYPSNAGDLFYMGRYIAIIYKVNEEYGNLYESTRQIDTRNLQEPLTNIENGLGIFTAFASDTVSFVVTR